MATGGPGGTEDFPHETLIPWIDKMGTEDLNHVVALMFLRDQHISTQFLLASVVGEQPHMEVN